MEETNSRFCRDYFAVLQQAEHLILDRNQETSENVRSFTQDMFHRLTFLRLVECRNCIHLNGRTDYLRALHEAGPLDSQSFYQSRIQPLLQAIERDQPMPGPKVTGQIHSLVGVPFRPPRQTGNVTDVPDAVFDLLFGKQAVEGLFYRYPFTADESTDSSTEAITPEILGTLFEQLAAARDRSGVYYTSRWTVVQMCRETLLGHLEQVVGLPEGIACDLVGRHDATGIGQQTACQIIETLNKLKAVDPACGCGAFLMVLLHELFTIYQTLYERWPHCLQTGTVSTNVGVPSASTPLQPIAHEPRTRAVRMSGSKTDCDSPRPAPSRYTLKQRIISQNIHGVDIDPKGVAITKLRLWLALVAESTPPFPSPLPDFNIETGDSLLGPDPQDALDSTRPSKPSKVGSVAHGTNPDAIYWQTCFPNVFARPAAGFDIVIGNPPYVDAHTMVKRAPGYRAAISRQFDTATGTWDLYIPFWERAIQLLNHNGIATLITPNKWFSTRYGKRLREAARPMLWQILDYSDFRAFQNMGVASLVVSLKKAGNATVRIRHFSDQKTISHQSRIASEQIASLSKWGMLLSQHLEFLVRLLESNTALAKICLVEEAWTVSQAYKLTAHVHELRGDEQSVFKFVNTGTIDPYVSLWGTKLTTYLKSQYKRPVVSRRAMRVHFPNRYTQMADSKLILSGMRHFEAFLDPCGAWASGISTVVLRRIRPPYSTLFLLGLLNSRLIRFVMNECYGSLSVDRGINFSRLNVSTLPVPALSRATEPIASEISRTAQKIAAFKAADPTASIESFQGHIDALVYQMFALSTDEIASIENS